MYMVLKQHFTLLFCICITEQLRRTKRISVKMREAGHVSEREQELINSQPTLSDKAQCLIKCVFNKAKINSSSTMQEISDTFIEALKHTNQDYLGNYFQN